MKRTEKVKAILKQVLDVEGTLADKTAELIVRALEHGKRSLPQNNYYWGVIIDISRDYFGYSSDEMHEAFKWKFLRQGSPDLPTVRSTASKDFTTRDAEDYYEQIRIFMAGYGVIIPLPKEET
jgi:hypothetical protein